jgi:hypothetical protein
MWGFTQGHACALTVLVLASPDHPERTLELQTKRRYRGSPTAPHIRTAPCRVYSR